MPNRFHRPEPYRYKTSEFAGEIADLIQHLDREGVPKNLHAAAIESFGRERLGYQIWEGIIGLPEQWWHETAQAAGNVADPKADAASEIAGSLSEIAGALLGRKTI